MANSRYTYQVFAGEVMALATLALESKLIDATQAERMTEKAQALAGTQAKKAEYNKNNPKKQAPKGASEKTQATADAIQAVLTVDNPMTTTDINEKLGTEFSALQVANAIKFIPNWTKSTVIREVVNSKGLKAQKEYTAYSLTE